MAERVQTTTTALASGVAAVASLLLRVDLQQQELRGAAHGARRGAAPGAIAEQQRRCAESLLLGSGLPAFLDAGCCSPRRRRRRCRPRRRAKRRRRRSSSRPRPTPRCAFARRSRLEARERRSKSEEDPPRLRSSGAAAAGGGSSSEVDFVADEANILLAPPLHLLAVASTAVRSSKDRDHSSGAPC